MYDLPSEDPEEPGLPDEFHDLQPQLLSRTLRLSRYTSERCFTASDLNLYYDVNQPQWYKRPDWFLAVDVPRLYDGKDLRRSYVIWQEGKAPYVAIEFLSPGTESEDLGRFYQAASQASPPQATLFSPDIAPDAEAPDIEAPDIEARSNGQTAKPPGKLVVYEQRLRIPHYIVYNRHSREIRYFKLDGGWYQEQPLRQTNPRIWLPDLEIGLGIWQGVFEGIPGDWLRWCDEQGTWLLTDTEEERRMRQQTEQQIDRERLAKEQAEQQVDQERLAKEQAQAQLLQAARNLLNTGMELNQVAEILGLSDAQIQALCFSE